MINSGYLSFSPVFAFIFRHEFSIFKLYFPIIFFLSIGEVDSVFLQYQLSFLIKI